MLSFRLWRRKDCPANNCMYNYGFNTTINGITTSVIIRSSCPIRNHETILRDRDEIIDCEHGHKLIPVGVAFSFNCSGEVLDRDVLICPKCDEIPPKSATLLVLT